VFYILQFSNPLSLLILPVPRNSRLEIAASARLAKESNDMKIVVMVVRKIGLVPRPSQVVHAPFSISVLTLQRQEYPLPPS
jgi:hypothetical protein